MTIVSQIFLTGRIAARGGLTMLLSIVPFAMIFGFIALAAWNTFAVLAVVYVTRRFGEYAFVRPGREMLFSPLDPREAYFPKSATGAVYSFGLPGEDEVDRMKSGKE